MPNRGSRPWHTKVRPSFSDRVKATPALVRIEGVKNDLAERAEAGYCPRRTRPTHIAVPNRYPAGWFSKEMDRSLSLWTEHGPRAAWRCAACVYAQPWGYLPQDWDWEAPSLKMAAPPFFDNLIGAVLANPPPHSIPPTTAEDASNP